MNPRSFFVKLTTRFQDARFIVVLVLVLVLDTILNLEDEHEDEYEKYQLRSPERAQV